MGTLTGHLVPGAFFLVLGLWWTFNIWDRYFQSLRSRRRFQATMSFPLRRGSRVPWENLVAIACTTSGIVGEIITGGGNLYEMGSGTQHIVMYLMFGMSNVAEGARVAGLELAPGLEYAFFVMAFVSEALLLATHGHGHSEMEMMVHHLLLCAVLAGGVSALMEALYRQTVMATLARAFFTLLQGTWFIQIGFILFPPDSWPARWDVGSHQQLKLASAVFILHCAGVMVGMATMGLVLRWRSGLGLRMRTPVSDGQHPQRDATKRLISSDDEF